MRKKDFNLYMEIEKRTSRKYADEPREYGIFERVDGGISKYGQYENAPDFSGLSNNLYFAIEEQPSGMENLNFNIAVWDYETRDKIDGWHMYIKTGNGKYNDKAYMALSFIRDILDDIQEEIYNGTLSLV